MDNTGFEPVTFHKAHLLECEAKIIPLDQLPLFVVSGFGHSPIQGWRQILCGLPQLAGTGDHGGNWHTYSAKRGGRGGSVHGAI